MEARARRINLSRESPLEVSISAPDQIGGCAPEAIMIAMRRFGLLAGAAWLIALAAPPRQAQAEPPPKPGGQVHFGEIGDPSKWPLSAIGTVRTTWGIAHTQQCTGTLVGPKLVLTAAHCVFYGNKLAPPANVHFLAGLDKGVPGAHSLAARLDVSPDFVRTEISAVNDWALITLETPLDIKPVEVRALSAAEFRAVAEANTAMQAGYGKDRPYLPSVHRNCAIAAGPNEETFTLRCLLNFGYSGSPVLAEVAGAPVIIGIMSWMTAPPDPGARIGTACASKQFAARAAELLRTK
jgi:V8-like Glu-specific endopeptidase